MSEDFEMLMAWLAQCGATGAECRLVQSRAVASVKEVWLFASGYGNQITRLMGGFDARGEWCRVRAVTGG